MEKNACINWNYPDPRNGFDRFVGPGATRAELLIQIVPALLFGLSFPVQSLVRSWGWSALQLIVVFILAFDLLGGVATNATGSAKRWYHRKGQTSRKHLVFIAIHFIQPFLVILFFDRWNWKFFFGAYGYLIAASLIIITLPLYLRRPAALLLLLGGIAIGLYVLPVPPRFDWFLPLFYTKLLVCHLLREEPYRPCTENGNWRDGCLGRM